MVSVMYYLMRIFVKRFRFCFIKCCMILFLTYHQHDNIHQKQEYPNKMYHYGETTLLLLCPFLLCSAQDPNCAYKVRILLINTQMRIHVKLYPEAEQLLRCFSQFSIIILCRASRIIISYTFHVSLSISAYISCTLLPEKSH